MPEPIKKKATRAKVARKMSTMDAYKQLLRQSGGKKPLGRLAGNRSSGAKKR